LDFYSLNGRVLIVQDFAENQGVELFTSSPSMQTGDLFAEIEAIAQEKGEQHAEGD
jgi:hypothetical protein